MPSDIYVKKNTGWSTAVTSIKAKTSSGWSTAAKFVYAKINAGWTRVWPLSGVYPNTNPFISNNTATTSEISYGTVLRVGNTYKGDRGSWNANGFTISSYDYKWLAYVNDTSTSTNYTQDFQSLTTQTNSLTITGTSAANFDKGWISFVVRANASNSAYSGTAGSLRYYVVRQRPRISVGTTPSFNTTSPKIGNTISYSSSWDTTDAYKPEAARTTIFWYKNSTDTTTGGTLVQTGGYSYVVQSTDLGNYIYVIETSFNSGSDYDLGSTVGISATAITSSAVTAAIAAPTISSITVSSIGGPVSVSFAGGSGPFYQMFWWGSATAPTGLTTPDASGSASPLTDNTGPTSTATQYMYVRSVTTQSDTGVANATTISPWSAGVSFNMTSASALTPTFGANTSTTNGFTGSVTNYDSAYNWNTPSNGSFTLTNGTWTWGTASGSTRPFTVTGLSSSQSSTATVTTTRADYSSGSASTTGTASPPAQYTVTWNANLSGATVSPDSNTVNSGTSVAAPTPTRSGYTFLYWRDGTTVFNYANQINPGGSWTVTSNITFYAWWSLNPIIPTITMGANSGITQTAGTINWTSTNQASFSSSGTISGSGTTATSVTNNSLLGGTNYTGTVTVTSSTGNTASANYSLTTSVAQYTVTWNANGGTGGGSTGPFNAGTSHTAPSPGTRSGFTFSGYYNTPSADFSYGPIASGGSFNPPSNITMYARWTSAFVVPTAGAPQVSNNQLGFIRSGTSVTWYSDYPSVSGDVSYIIGMEWQIRTTNSTTTTPLNTGTYAGGGSGDGLQGNTTKYITYPVSTTYPYSAAGNVWAFRIRSTENTAATSSTRYGRARVIMMGTNGTVYFGTWSTNI